MRQLLLSFCISIFFIVNAFSQSDNCSTASLISVTANCTSPTNGTTTGATSSLAGCVGTADDDVWYQFVATNTGQQITVTPSSGMDAVVQLFSGSCSSLTSLVCQDNAISGQAEIINANGLTSGTTYTIRIYHYGTGSGSGTFSICITNPPPPPGNDICGGAISLTVNLSCIYTGGTTVGATQSYSGCAGTADDDVWYKFVASNSTATITADPSTSMDAVMELYSGTCSSLNSIQCMDNGFTDGNEIINGVGLVAGNTYFVRVYDYYGGNGGGAFNICVSGPPASGVPTNDAPCNAIALPAVSSDCNYLQFTTTGSTASMGAPTPSSCTGGSGAQQGGFSTSSHDVWFSVVAPSNGQLTITPEPGYGITDGVMVLYSGTCGSLTQIGCSDDNNYPGSSNDMLPYISKTALTPGATYFIRYFGYGSTSGNFGICVASPTNDLCSNALYICDLNGYGGSTSAAYKPDRPCNMFANNETSSGVDQPDGTNTGGIFGQGGSWGYGSPYIDVNINNNSWIRFTASATTAVLNVAIGDCWVGNYPSGGVQMQIFSGTNCCNFTPVSNFEESSTGFTITANGLTIGNDYYLMVDGFAGDICNYSIQASSGVQFSNITATKTTLCFGGSTTLTAPNGASSYQWLPGGQTTQSITESPSTTTTYSCIVKGVCGAKQTLTKTIFVTPLPNVLINSGNPVNVCNGSSVNLSASGALIYLWSTGAFASSITVSPTVNTNYSVIGIDFFGCKDTTALTVSVSAPPVITIAATSTPSNCGQSTGSITGIAVSGTGILSYTWTNSSNVVVGTTSNLISQPAGTYNLTVTDANGCSSFFGPFSIVNPGAPTAPTITSSGTSVCVGSPISLTASSSSPSPTFTWTGPNSTGNLPTLTISPSTLADSGPYAVTVTSNGCTGPPAIINVTVNALPLANASVAPNTYCSGNSINLNASGGISYSWLGPNSFSSLFQNPGITNATTNMSGIYTVSVTDTNNCVNSDTVSITILPLPTTPTATAAANSICEGDNIQLYSSSNAGSTYSWTGPNGFSSASQNPFLSPTSVLSTGTYFVTSTLNNCSSAIDSINITVHANPITSASSSTSTICSGSTVNLFGIGGGTYNWAGPNGFNSNNSNDSIANCTTASAGTYTLIVSNTYNCKDTATVFVSVNQTPQPPITIGDSTCSGASLILSAIGSGIINWYSDASLTNLVQGNSNTYSPTVPIGTFYTYYVTVTHNGCTGNPSSVTASSADVIANATVSDTIGFTPIDIYFSNLSTGVDAGDNFLWLFGNGDSANTFNASYTYTNGGDYIVSLIVTETSSGCTDTAFIHVSYDGSSDLVIPNVFTPNNDNSNDVFQIITKGIETLDAEIYDRWGLKLYEWHTVKGSWDGRTASGVIASDGTYFYIMKAKAHNGDEYYKKGHFELIR